MNEPCVVFENTGELDPRLISTFGCSVKEGKNPIGFFGTGLKYAIAVLLRNNQKVIIQSGSRMYEPFLVKDVIRGKEFQFIYLDNNTSLGFTTELGKNWELWMAYRELHCNAIDEQDAKVYINQSPLPSSGRTRIIVEGQQFMNVHIRRGEFLIQDPPWQTLEGLEVRNRPNDSVFYRGIKVAKLDHPSRMTYNITEQIQLTEDRTASSMYDVVHKISRNILCHADEELLEKVLITSEHAFEFFLDYNGWGLEPSKDFYPTVKRLQQHNLMNLNRSAVRLWREKGEGFIDPKRVAMTEFQTNSLNKAIKFCNFMGYPVAEDYPVMVVASLGENVLAIADRMGKQIMLSQNIFSRGGTRLVVRALLEEYIHLKLGFDDNSMDMQDYLFNQLISQAEERIGESL